MKFQSKTKIPSLPTQQKCHLNFVFNKTFLESHRFGSLKTSVFILGGVRWWITVYFNYKDELCFSLSCDCNVLVSAYLECTLQSPIRKAWISFKFRRGFNESTIFPLISRDNLFKYYFQNGNKYVNLKLNGCLISFG